jgi:hypothetical protein
MAKESHKQKISNLQQNKRRNSPTSASIRQAMKNKYPLGFSKNRRGNQEGK